MNLIGAKVVRVHNGIYSVELIDDEFGARVVHFNMPFFDQDAFNRIIAAQHVAWMVEGNTPPEKVPEIDLDDVNKKALEYIEARKDSDAENKSFEGLAVDSLGGGSHPGMLVDPMGLADPSDPESGDPGGPGPNVWNDGGDTVPEARNEPPVVAHERGNPTTAGAEAAEGQPAADTAGEGERNQPGDPEPAGPETTRS